MSLCGREFVYKVFVAGENMPELKRSAAAALELMKVVGTVTPATLAYVGKVR